MLCLLELIVDMVQHRDFFAIETAVNELAEKLHMDPMKLREMNIVKEGQVMPAFYGETNTSCALDRCIAKVKEMSHWDENYPVRELGHGKSVLLVWDLPCRDLVSVD